MIDHNTESIQRTVSLKFDACLDYNFERNDVAYDCSR